MITRRLQLFALTACVALCTACSTTAPVRPQAERGARPVLSDNLGAFKAVVPVNVVPTEGASVTLKLRVWRDGGGRVFVSMDKLGTEIAQVAFANGQLDCWLPRAGVRYVGSATAAGIPAMVGRLDVIAGELGDGAVPVAPVPGAGTWDLPQGDLRAEVETDAQGTVLGKVLRSGQKIVARISYNGQTTFDGANRAKKITVTLPDGTTLIAEPASIDAQAEVSPKRFVLHPDADGAVRVDVRGLEKAIETME